MRPDGVYVAKGASSRGFTVATLATTTRATGTVTATYRRKSLRRGLTRLVTPCYPAPVPRSVVLSSTLRAGGRASGSVMLDCAARTPLTVSLDASSGRVSVPPVVRVPAGARTASFEVSARMPGSSEDAYDATIRATAGTRSVTGLLTVEPALRDLAIEQISGT